MKPLFQSILHAFWYDPTAALTWLKVLVLIAIVVAVVRWLRRWPVLQPFFHALWNDPVAVKRWIWGVSGFLATLGAGVFVEGVEVALTWTPRQWAARIVTSLIALVLTMINPAKKKPEPVAAEVPQ